MYIRPKLATAVKSPPTGRLTAMIEANLEQSGDGKPAQLLDLRPMFSSGVKGIRLCEICHIYYLEVSGRVSDASQRQEKLPGCHSPNAKVTPRHC